MSAKTGFILNPCNISIRKFLSSRRNVPAMAVLE